MVLDPSIYLTFGFIILVLIFVVGVIQRQTLFKSGLKNESVGLLLLALPYAALLYPYGVLNWSVWPSHLERYAIMFSLQVAAALWLTFVFLLAVLEVVRLRMSWQVGLTYLLLWISLVPAFELTLAGAMSSFHVFGVAYPSIIMLVVYLAPNVFDSVLVIGIAFFVPALLFAGFSVWKGLVFQEGTKPPRFPAVASVVYAVGMAFLIDGGILAVTYYLLPFVGVLCAIGVVLVVVANAWIATRHKEQKEKADKEEVQKLRKRVEELEQKAKSQ
jgi:hypothetical protein